MSSRYKSIRTTVALVMSIVLLLGFIFDLYKIQVVDEEYYAAQNNAIKTYKVEIPAARGEIVDRNGNTLVKNRQGNSIVLDAAYFPSAKDNEKRNEIILSLIELFNKNGEEYVHNLPLKFDSFGNVVFYDENDSDTYEKDIVNLKNKDMLNLQHYANAQNCFDVMVEKYGLQKYDKRTALEIGSIRYELTRLLFSVSNAVTIAQDVSDQTVAQIKEDTDKYLGADVEVVAYRDYNDSTLAPHILGTVRKINAEEYEALKDEGYKITDEIGESGIEASMEEYLRGTPGEKTITINAEGEVTQEVTRAPIQGDTIVLTIDKNMQKIAQDKLRDVCLSVDAYDSTGAVVVQDVNTGEVLAAANYPSYDLNQYYENYDNLANDRLKPLYNRFAMGAYAPGSTFKPMMACAALQEGVVNADTRFTCHSVFTVKDMTFGCRDAHGSEDVREALRDSCNIYFYNCADLLGIEKMNAYGTMFGLGQKTGVEIPESKGILAGKEYRQAHNMTWNPGDTIQAGIGQSDNLFTPLQLSNYCATIANGGTRYQLHFVKAKISNATGISNETPINVSDEVTVSDENLNIVKEGMRLVATKGGPWRIFDQIETPVACKTGTSQVIVNGEKKNNGFLITFAPYDNPEISIASAIERAGSGTSTAEITASIIDYYYSHNTSEKVTDDYGTLIN